MAYKYEQKVVSLLEKLDIEERNYTFVGIDDEVKEVYAKAKAWDNYLADVENSVREVTGKEDEVKWHVDYVINEYMEDK
ncbi:hypothetical protein [Mammaliicoccus sciuri]|uniref:hypothetical protein n=1 Tax=Mammaliicoccus sciuri TaxID=1296 RepID=UPI001FB1F2A5|nr:hypothetical protein [Mammaliicoccus sciuri]MCJ1785206.1 hypothetical protein [Mammaliicoccus sciuri]